MNRARLGFTLIEITVVLVILGVVAAVVAPALPPTRQPGDEEARSLARA
jgi:prepilin-type N-terminal cleavage/methylation domain-containing protein